MKKITIIFVALALFGACFSIPLSENAEAVFIDSVTVPWDSQFIPNDSAWDATGNLCMVVGNDTASTPESNAWAYSSSDDSWMQVNATSGGSTATPAPQTIYVGSGAGNYSAAIQPAIDAASPGDTVFVWPGTYFERVTIGKRLDFTGHDRVNTIIDGSAGGHVVEITGQGVNMTGFTVRNAGGSNAGVRIYLTSDCRVENVLSTNNYYGIWSHFSSDIKILDNTANLNSGMGIYLAAGSNHLVRGNTLTGNYYGVYVESTSGNSIYNNNFVGNTNHVYDEGVNTWNLDKNQGGGNYWSDWTSPDGGDGFVTISRPIFGGTNVDLFPWVLENGWVGEIVVDGISGVNRRVNDDPGLTMQRASSVAIGTDGTIYIAWEDTRNGNSDIYFAKSTNGGQTFGANIRVNNVIVSEQTAPSLAVDALTGNIYIAWEDFSNGVHLDIYFSRSIDGGLTFLNSIRVNSDAGTAIQSSPSVAVGPDGTVYVAWSDYRNVDSDIYFAKSIDNGQSFGANVRVDSAPGGSDQQRPSIAAYSTNVCFTWHDVRTGNSDIYFRMSTDRGNTFGAEKILNTDGSGTSQSFPDIAVGPEGNIYVAWQDYRNGNSDIFFTRSTDNGANFISNLRLDNDGTAMEQIRPSVAIGPSGYVYVAWEDARSGVTTHHIYFARSTNSGLSFEINRKYTTEPGSKTQPSLAIHPDGKVYCAWGDNRLDTSDVYFARYVEYSTIQSAINAARPMWTVRVIPATYNERLNINKRITLKGESQLTTIVNAGGISNVINVTASNVHITTITLTNTGINGWGININSVDNCRISDTKITTNYGILMIYGAGGHLVENNSVTAQITIQLEIINGNTIQNNDLAGSSYGINLYNSDNNIFRKNIIRDSTGQGTYIESSNLNTFYGNTIQNNNYGIYLDSGTGNSFYNNNFISNNFIEDWTGASFWNIALPGGGNYWDDWTTPDRNCDGIVDSPKSFTGGQDNFPWTKASGWVAQDWVLIHDVWELQAMNNDLTASYALANDIDATATAAWNGGLGFIPVGFSGTSFTGSLDGRGHKITDLKISRPTTNYGVGLFGFMDAGSTVFDLGLENAVVNGGTFGSGALVGSCVGSITRCYSTGTITGPTFSYVGGLVGYLAPGGSLTDSYSRASVSGDVDVGGLVGRAWSYISNCYSTGAVLSGMNRGGLAGSNYDTVIYSFYDRETSGQTDTGKGDPKFTAEMKTQATFVSVGWDFATVWQMQEGVTYPLLRKPGVTGGSDPYPPLNGVAWDSVSSRFLLCGETGGASSVFYVRPQNMSAMVPVPNSPEYSFFAIATDHLGNFLVGGNGLDGLYYFDKNTEVWTRVSESGSGSMDGWNVTGITFNANDHRFYIAGNLINQDKGAAFYSDVAPLNWAGAQCYMDSSDFMNMPGPGGIKSIQWNPVHNYGLAVGDGVYRVEMYDGNVYDEMNWTVIQEPDIDNLYLDISWDTDGWNEAGIVGRNQTYGNYRRYYDSNPQLIQGYKDPATGTKYRTCAMKPPSSPKWLFIPHAGGGVRMNIQEKDQSSQLIITSEFPHIFAMGMWRQSDPTRLSTLGTQVSVDSTYTFFVEGNYTRGGIDQWGTTMRMWLQVWYDAGLAGTNSNPADMTWTSDALRTRQLNISYNSALGTATLNYPDTGLGVQEFAIHSMWVDPTLYGADLSHHRLYLNVTFGKQTCVAPGDGTFDGPTATPWDKNALDDIMSWDVKAMMYDAGVLQAFNASYEEFGVERYAAISVSGQPTASIPPGMTDVLAPSSVIQYSTNSLYTLNVSIPNLLKDGNPLRWIPATDVTVHTTHPNADPGNSDISGAGASFPGPDQKLCVWGRSSGVTILPVGNGTVSAGPDYSDYTAASKFLPFTQTDIVWTVTVDPATEEGIYRATITVTLYCP